MPFPVLEVLGIVFKPLVDLVDELHTSEEERGKMKVELFNAQSALFMKVLDFEKSLLEAQSRVLEAEAKSEHWLTSNWRPLVMVTFTGLVVARWFGLSANIPPEIEAQLWTVIQIGLGGYVAGRSVEKIADTVGKALEKRNMV